MKYLSEYLEEGTSAALTQAGAFFAFGQDQYDAAAQQGVEYVSMGAGLVCPKSNAASLRKALDDNYDNGVKQDKADHTPEQIIRRELGNYECQISMDDSEARASLASYGFTDEQFKSAWDVFWQDCIDNDYF